MSIHANPDTVLGQIAGRPLNMKRSIANTPMTVVAEQLLKYTANLGKELLASPEKEALSFYALEHAAGMVRAKVGPHDNLGKLRVVLDTYNSRSLKAAARAYYYLLLICWREMRHCSTKTSTYPAAGEAAGADPAKMASLLNRCSDTTDFTSIAKVWEAHAEDITLGQLTKALVYGFNKGKWGLNYGGKKWGVVTACLDSFVHGQTSAAMMLDTIWTLAHNGGPIFNKSMLYSNYDYTLIEILDVQRAGMIPQYILTAKMQGYAGAGNITASFLREIQALGLVLEGEFGGKTQVDWVAVKALGAKGQYAKYAQKLGQVEPPPSQSTKVEFGSGKPSVFDAFAEPATPAFSQTKIVVPGVKVKLGRAA